MWRFAILSVLILTSPAFAQKNPPGVDPVTCDEEKDCLAKLPGKASRKGRALTLRLEDGKSKIFVDSKNCATDEENCTTYSLLGYRPTQGVYLISWSGWESGGVTLVSAKTGQVEELPSAPEFSPSGNWLVAHGSDYDRRLTIWSIRAGEMKREFVYDYDFPEGGELWSVLGWDGENRIRLQVSLSASDGQDIDTDAVLKEQGWVLNWPFPN